MATDALVAHSPDPSASAPGPSASAAWDQHSVNNDYSSYAGSFGSNSDWGQNDNDAAAGGLAAFAADDAYNPTDFDASPPDYNALNSSAAQPGSLNFFDHENLQPDVLADLDLQPAAGQQFISLSFTPAEPFSKHHSANNNPPSPFVNPSDLSSPGSSPGSIHNAGNGRHSRASSVGSIHHSPLLHHPQLATSGPSPPTSPPEIKAASPPALVIPSESTGPLNQPTLSRSHLLPTAGIDINIVPSTPISPGTAANTVPFQQVLQNLNQSAGAPVNNGDRTARTPSPQPMPAGSPRASPANIMDVASPMWNNVSVSHTPQGSPYRPALHFRDHSEDSVRISHSPHGSVHSLQGSPHLPPAPFPRGADLATGLVNLSLGLNGGAPPPAVFSGQSNADMLLAAAQLRSRSRSDTNMHPPAWGPHAPQNQQMFQGSGNFGMGGLGLSGMPQSGMTTFPGPVDPSFSPMNFNLGPAPAQQFGGGLPPFRMAGAHSYDDADNMLLPGIRRSRTDAGMGHRRGVRSEDFSMYGPPGQPDNNEMLRSITTPDGSLAPSDPRMSLSPGIRRRSSARGAGQHERGSSVSSGRPSPYPSPNASPRHPGELLPGTLPLGDVSAVSRPHVTTPATAVASNSRRKSEANFVCPVPGCGSTFTRHFNLKGHLRSHNEERPFKCKWPGCEKGFARQHDCKRHEALHLNIRPYTCDGCGKTFARMDALNRHLRSEGGVECRRLGDDGGDVNMANGYNDMSGLQPMALGRDGDEWTAGGALVL